MMFERCGEDQQATWMSSHGTDQMIARNSHRLWALFAGVLCVDPALHDYLPDYRIDMMSCDCHGGHWARRLLLLLLSVVVISEC